MSTFPWGSHERQGTAPEIIYKQIPEYQPSQATITLGEQLYKPSRKAENISVGAFALDATAIALIAVPVGILVIWLLTRKKKRKG